MMEFLSFNKSIDIEKMLKEHTLTKEERAASEHL